MVVGAGLTGLTTALLLARGGKRVHVLEARQIGSVTTGHTSGKVSLLQGTKLSRMLEVQSEQVARSYLEANHEGQAWLLRFCADHDVQVDTRDAVTYAATPAQRVSAEAEYRATRRLGLPSRWTEDVEVPFPTHGAAVLADQAQINPMKVLAALASQVREHGGTIEEHSRVVSVSRWGRPTVRTSDDRVLRCDDVVLATGTPFLDRGLYFAKVEAHRSYVLLYSTGEHVPEQMLLSAGSPTISLRDVPGEGDLPRLMVGGNGHVVGRTRSEVQHLDELRAWVARHYPGATETHAWSAQDYASHDGIPYVGKLPRGLGHLYLATGYDKWGLTNGVAAALRIAGEILGHSPTWARPMSRRVTRPRSAATLLTRNMAVGRALATGIAAAELKQAPERPADGSGVIGRAGLSPVPIGTSQVDGAVCRVSGVCTHLGGVLKWNDSETTWDCPLHGSRFSADGQVLEGPATRPLVQLS